MTATGGAAGALTVPATTMPNHQTADEHLETNWVMSRRSAARLGSDFFQEAWSDASVVVRRGPCLVDISAQNLRSTPGGD
jgi:hypothetical protein